jgi:hypothetical protein
MLHRLSLWFLSHLVPIRSGQTWKDKQKERYYRVVSVGRDYVICDKLFFKDKYTFSRKEFRRSLYINMT